ncbi:MAG: FAD-binding oxidoreductase [bacterium]|nr:FAD-binding oxidoreductase [bacterium]
MIETLIKIFGKENVADSRSDQIVYGTDASRIEGSAIAVVFPKTTTQLQKLARFASLHNVSIVPRGAGTGLAGAVVPQNSVVIDFSRMNNIKQINIKDSTVTVEPGVILDDLNNTLVKYQLFFPIRPSSHSTATIGGMISTNAAGCRAVKYGSTKKWVQELDVIDGTGKLFTISGNEISDFAGMEGITGLISKAKLKLTVPIKSITMSVFTFDKIEALIDKVEELKKTNVVSMEFMNHITSELVGLEAKHHLFVEFQDDSGEIKDLVDIEAMEKTRDSSYSVVASQGYSIIEDPQLDLKVMPEFLNWVQQNNVPCFGHIALGTVHPCFASDEKISEMYDLVKTLKGTISGEHGFGIKKKGFLDPVIIERAQNLKKKYDPNNVMNRGKVI